MSTDTTEATLSSIQQALMDTISALKSGQLNVSQAKAINDLSQTAINGGKLQLDYLRHTKQLNSRFLNAQGQANELPNPTTENGRQGTITHTPKSPATPWDVLGHKLRDDDE